jgi:hypothetical protein
VCAGAQGLRRVHGVSEMRGAPGTRAAASSTRTPTHLLVGGLGCNCVALTAWW